jgi:hypothetical protein
MKAAQANWQRRGSRTPPMAKIACVLSTRPLVTSPPSLAPLQNTRTKLESGTAVRQRTSSVATLDRLLPISQRTSTPFCKQNMVLSCFMRFKPNSSVFVLPSETVSGMAPTALP